MLPRDAIVSTLSAPVFLFLYFFFYVTVFYSCDFFVFAQALIRDSPAALLQFRFRRRIFSRSLPLFVIFCYSPTT